ncbi:MAG: hypothetical protein HQM08_01375 [Candidatus Riflebacteria bacterium]|nr:hypothetical protein [Candidatus Riflebacteria bacterium]
MEFNNESQVICWILKNQLGRRNLSDAQRVKCAEKLTEHLREKAKANQLGALKQNTGQQESAGDSPVLLNSSKRINTRKEIAKAAKVSEDRVARLQRLEKSDSELYNQHCRGEISLNCALEKVKENQKAKFFPEEVTEKQRTEVTLEEVKENKSAEGVPEEKQNPPDSETIEIYKKDENLLYEFMPSGYCRFSTVIAFDGTYVFYIPEQRLKRLTKENPVAIEAGFLQINFT